MPGSFEGSYPAYASGGGYVIAALGTLAVAGSAPRPPLWRRLHTGLCFPGLELWPQDHKGFLTAWPADRTVNFCLRDLLLLVPPLPSCTASGPGNSCRTLGSSAEPRRWERGDQGSPWRG